MECLHDNREGETSLMLVACLTNWQLAGPHALRPFCVRHALTRLVWASHLGLGLVRCLEFCHLYNVALEQHLEALLSDPEEISQTHHGSKAHPHEVADGCGLARVPTNAKGGSSLLICEAASCLKGGSTFCIAWRHPCGAGHHRRLCFRSSAGSRRGAASNAGGIAAAGAGASAAGACAIITAAATALSLRRN